MFGVTAQISRKENMYEIRGLLFEPVSGDESRQKTCTAAL